MIQIQIYYHRSPEAKITENVVCNLTQEQFTDCSFSDHNPEVNSLVTGDETLLIGCEVPVVDTCRVRWGCHRGIVFETKKAVLGSLGMSPEGDGSSLK